MKKPAPSCNGARQGPLRPEVRPWAPGYAIAGPPERLPPENGGHCYDADHDGERSATGHPLCFPKPSATATNAEPSTRPTFVIGPRNNFRARALSESRQVQIEARRSE